MKKLILLVLLTLGSNATDSPYIGAGLLVSNADGDLVSCRAGTTLLGGVTFYDGDYDFSMSFEGRTSTAMNGSYLSRGLYVKPEYKGLYALVGMGDTTYTEQDLKFSGARYGIGYDFGKKARHLFVDITYKNDERDYVITTGFRYVFEGL